MEMDVNNISSRFMRRSREYIGIFLESYLLECCGMEGVLLTYNAFDEHPHTYGGLTSTLLFPYHRYRCVPCSTLSTSASSPQPTHITPASSP